MTMLFGIAQALGNLMQLTTIPTELIQMVPYLTTLIGLAVYSYVTMKRKTGFSRSRRSEMLLAQEAPEVSTTFAAMRLAMRIDSGSDLPSCSQAITAPMWESPAPIVSICVVAIPGTLAGGRGSAIVCTLCIEGVDDIVLGAGEDGIGGSVNAVFFCERKSFILVEMHHRMQRIDA